MWVYRRPSTPRQLRKLTPTLFTATVDQTVTGVLFSKPPAFVAGTITPVFTINGVLFSRPPTFIAGVVSATNIIDGVLFLRPPTFIPGAVTPSFTIHANEDGTIVNVVDELDTTIDLFLSVDDDPATPTDSDWVNNTSLTASVFFELQNTPATFETALTADLIVRYRGQNWSGASLTLFAQLFQSDESSALSDEETVAIVSGDGSFANTSVVSFSGVVAGSKVLWDGARIRFRWS